MIVIVIGYNNSDWVGDMNDRKSTISFVFFMGETTVTWSLKQKPIIILSTCEAEYIATTTCVCHSIWLR
jgi:hypothetical protein